jgi:hypothetical protein
MTNATQTDAKNYLRADQGTVGYFAGLLWEKAQSGIRHDFSFAFPASVNCQMAFESNQLQNLPNNIQKNTATAPVVHKYGWRLK